MKQKLIYFQFFFASFCILHAMEPVPFDGFSFLPTELFHTIMMLTRSTEPKQQNVNSFFTTLRRLYAVCTYWHTQITGHKNWYGSCFGLLPLHVAALTNDIMAIVNFKIDQKGQLWQKDKNDSLITRYAHKDIYFILQKYCRPLDTYPRGLTIMRYEKRIKKICKKLDKKDKKKFKRFLNIIILEYKIHSELNYYLLTMHLRTFDTLINMRGNINAYDEEGLTFVDKSCMAIGYFPYLRYLLKKSQVRDYMIEKKNAKEALKKCILNSYVDIMNMICMLKNFDINKAYPNCAYFFVARRGRYSSKCSPIETYLKTLNINWEINKQKNELATPLMLLTNTTRDDLVLWLLKEKRVDPNAQNNDGNTALHFAAKIKNKNGKIINLLLDYNANSSIKNKHAKIPVDLAKNSFNRELLLRRSPQSLML